MRTALIYQGSPTANGAVSDAPRSLSRNGLNKSLGAARAASTLTWFGHAYLVFKAFSIHSWKLAAN